MQRRSGGRGLGAVLFTDIVGSTAIAAEMGNTRWGELVARHHRIVRQLLGRFGGREVDTAGDGFFVMFERPADAIRCAAAAVAAVRELGIELRAGVTFGEVEIVGAKPGGLVVNTAARVMGVAGPGEVLVPASVRDLVLGSGIVFTEHGLHQLKGLEGDYRLYRVAEVDGRAVAPPLGAEQAAERRREIFPTRPRRTALLVGAAAGLVALASLAAILVSRLAADEPTRSRTNGPLRHAVARVDVDGAGVGPGIPLRGPGPDYHGFVLVDRPLAAGEGGVWLIRPPSLLHIDPRHREVRTELVDVGVAQSQTVLTGFDAVWALSGRTIYRIHPSTDEVDEALVLPERAAITTWSMALGDAIWVGVSDGTLVRFDPLTGARDQIDTGISIDAIATTTDQVWVADILAGAVFPFDTGSLRRDGRPIEIDGSIDQLLGSGRSLWILDRQLGVVTRLDTSVGRLTGSTRVGNEPTGMAASTDTLWVGDLAGSLYGIDPLTLESTEIEVGAEVLAVDVDDVDGGVWLYVGRPTGGT